MAWARRSFWIVWTTKCATGNTTRRGRQQRRGWWFKRQFWVAIRFVLIFFLYHFSMPNMTWFIWIIIIIWKWVFIFRIKRVWPSISLKQIWMSFLEQLAIQSRASQAVAIRVSHSIDQLIHSLVHSLTFSILVFPVLMLRNRFHGGEGKSLTILSLFFKLSKAFELYSNELINISCLFVFLLDSLLLINGLTNLFISNIVLMTSSTQGSFALFYTLKQITTWNLNKDWPVFKNISHKIIISKHEIEFAWLNESENLLCFWFHTNGNAEILLPFVISLLKCISLTHFASL